MPTQAQSTREDTLNRLRSIAGHVNGIVRMVEEDQYCIDVINQVQAVQAALNKVSVQILDRHMHHCVIKAIQGQDPEERGWVLSELRDVFAVCSRL